MVAQGNVGVAFALVIGAGLSTTLGASAAFFAKLASPWFLAVGLGLAAGVMLYVSFVEIFVQKGIAELEASGLGSDKAYQYGTLLLFAGMLLTGVLDVIVHAASRFTGARASKDAANVTELRAHSPGAPAVDGGKADVESGLAVTLAPDNRKQCSATLETASDSHATSDDRAPINHVGEVHLANRPADMPAVAADAVDAYLTVDHHRFGLQKMACMTAVAISIHNIPEGLATFVAALADPLNGVAIAIAIALHNIPEGVCVAMPVYYATGSRFKGFLWAFLSGLSEVLGGLLGYLVLYGSRMTETAYGLTFCLVAGMMIYISVVELLPTALKFDPDNKVTSFSCIGGMVIMAASLLAFTI